MHVSNGREVCSAVIYSRLVRNNHNVTDNSTVITILTKRISAIDCLKLIFEIFFHTEQRETKGKQSVTTHDRIQLVRLHPEAVPGGQEGYITSSYKQRCLSHQLHGANFPIPVTRPFPSLPSPFIRPSTPSQPTFPFHLSSPLLPFLLPFPNPARVSGGAVSFPIARSGAEPKPKIEFGAF